jgi:aminocarboxymuconate-semialdehyde decarboxylase
MLEAKAAAGIDLTIVGSPTGAGPMAPVAGVDPYSQPLDRLRWFHDWLGELVAGRRSQLRAYAWCSAFADDAMLQVVADLVHTDEFVGIIANTSVDGEYLDSPRADPFFAMAADLGVPVLLHPGADPAAGRGVTDYGLVEMVGRHCDVTMGLAAVVLSGRLSEHPDLKIIGASAGGALGLLPQRLEMAWRPRHWGPPGGSGPAADRHRKLYRARRGSEPPSAVLPRVFVDTTADGPHALTMNVDVFGAGQVLFGTDRPPVPMDHVERIRTIENLPISRADQLAILGGNAMRVFGLAELAPSRADSAADVGVTASGGSR